MTGLLEAPRELSSRLASLGTDEHTKLLALAAAVGVATGLVVTAFYRIIDVVQGAVLVSAGSVDVADALLIPATVALGLTACYALVHWGARDSEGENVPDVMYRVNVKGGVIRGTFVAWKSVGAAVTIGTGGSVGPEGPVIVAGAAAASRIGRWLRVSPNHLRTLVGCGAAAGISAAFNAPIAGVIFGVEKILGAAGGMALGPFVVASILAASVGRAIFGNRPVLAIPVEHVTGSAWELLLYVALGVITGVVAVLYSRGIWRAHDLFAKAPEAWRRILVGALVVGALNVVFKADLWGHGHQSIDLGIVAERGAWFLLGLAGAKLLATAVTLAVAGTGGVFTPALFVGATLGGAVGLAALGAVPGLTIEPGAVALVGMAGLVSGATHAPLTAILMVFEMTGDYGLILPLMLTSVIAYFVARRLHPESVYTEWLVRRGVVLSQGADAALLARVPVSECYNRRPVTIQGTATLAAIIEGTRESRQSDFPVLDGDGRVLGILTQQAIRNALAEQGRPERGAIALDLANARFDRVTPEDSLLTALRRLGSRDVNSLPVVRVDGSGRLEGIVTRQDLLAAYERFLTAEPH